MLRNARLVVASSFLAAAVLVALPRVAAAQEGALVNGVAMKLSRGLGLDVGPTLLFPLREGGPYGGGLSVEGRYGIPLGPTVVAPGGRVAGYIISDRGVGIAMPTVRVTVPVGMFAPYLVGGVGVGYLSRDGQTGAALLGGGGFMIHIGRGVAFGAEATYQAITGTELNTLTITPAIAFGG